MAHNKRISGTSKHTSAAHDHDPLDAIRSYHGNEKATILTHVEELGPADANALTKKIARQLGMTMLPQLWIV
jgi:hypothetical protein